MSKKLVDRLPIFSDPYVRRLLGYLPAHKKEIALAVVCMILGAASSSLIALLLGKLTDLGFYEHNPAIVWWTPVGLIGISILHGGTQFHSNYLLQRVSQHVLVRIRRLMFSHLIQWSSQTYQRYMPGKIVSFDPSTGLATVLPIMKFRKPDGSTMEYPQITGVPVMFPQSMNQQATIAYPIKPDDGCIILVAEQSIDYWM